MRFYTSATLILVLVLSNCAVEEQKAEQETPATTTTTGQTQSYDFGTLISSKKLDSGAAEDLVVVGSYAYVAAKSGGVQVINTSTNSTAHSIAFQSGGETWDLTTYSNTLVIAERSAGVSLYSIASVSDSSAPQYITTLTPGFNIDSVAVNADNTRLVAAGASGKIQLYDISGSTPATLGSTPTHTLSSGKNVSSVAISGSHIFAGDADGKLFAVDISTVGSPSEASTYQSTAVPGHSAWGLGLSIDHTKKRLYYSNWGGGFIIIDFNTPTELKELGRCMTGDGVYDSAINNDRAYLANSFGGIAVLDITNPESMQLMGHRYIKNTVNDGGINKTLNPHGIVYADNKVYIADNSAQTMSVTSVDETSLANETLPVASETTGNMTDKGTYSYGELVDYIEVGFAEEVVIDGSYAYVAAKAYGVHVIDISNFEVPVLKKTINTNGSAYNLAVSGSRLYIADRDNGVVVVDISTPASAAITTTIDAGINVVDLAVNSTTVYAVGGDGTDGYLKIINAADLNNVVVSGSHKITGKAGTSVGFDTSHVYYGASDGTLYALNVSDPANITQETTTFSNAGQPGHEPWGLGITIDGTNDVLYYSNWGAGLIAVNISNPASMSETAVQYTGDGVYDSFMVGTKLYFANSWGGIGVLDITTPSSMSLISDQNADAGDYINYEITRSGFDYPAAPHGIAVSGNYTLVADNSSGTLAIIYTGP